MTLKEQKQQIETRIVAADLTRAKELLDSYSKDYPNDTDIISLKMMMALAEADYDLAFELANKAAEITPLNGDVYYNLGYIYELLGNTLMAYYEYDRAFSMYKHTRTEAIDELNISTKTEELLGEIKNILNDKSVPFELKIEQNELLKAILEMQRNEYGFCENAYRSYEAVIGGYIREDLSKKRYVGVYHNQYWCVTQRMKKTNGMEVLEDKADLIHYRGEFLEVTEGLEKTINIEDSGDDLECLIPIACEEYDTIHMFKKDSCMENYIIQRLDKSFSYYRVPNNTVIQSTKKSYYGAPIPLKHSPSRKRLIMSIFVDGLAGEAIQGDDFRNRMPNTYSFFSKGTICDNAFTCGEWTYPSIANITTGLYSTRHSLVNTNVDLAVPQNYPTLDEYYKEAGYYTGKFSGNWRIIPSYGYTRGVDRFLYQNATNSYKIEEVIGDTIDHLEAFDETDKYLWISIGDLHDIGDGFELPINIQTHMQTDIRTIEERGKTSVKQEYSSNKRERFIYYLRHIDRWLDVLFRYIEKHYDDNEIVISLFADHGQSYMVRDDSHFCSKELTKVAFMFRGSGANGLGRTQELISTVDYGCIMRKLAGLNETSGDIDGRLPAIFGGKEERRYTISDNLFPGDPYRVAIHGNDEVFYLTNHETVRYDGKFHFDDYECYMEDYEGEMVIDEEKKEYYLDIVKRHIATSIIYE